MKKKVLFITLMIVVFFTASINLSQIDGQKFEGLSLTIKNMVALADGEAGGQVDCTNRCWFNSMELCYLQYPYACLGTRIYPV